jgi:hypothetical protein
MFSRDTELYYRQLFDIGQYPTTLVTGWNGIFWGFLIIIFPMLVVCRERAACTSDGAGIPQRTQHKQILCDCHHATEDVSIPGNVFFIKKTFLTYV